jgi:hypothetical protein
MNVDKNPQRDADVETSGGRISRARCRAANANGQVSGHEEVI